MRLAFTLATALVTMSGCGLDAAGLANDGAPSNGDGGAANTGGDAAIADARGDALFSSEGGGGEASVDGGTLPCTKPPGACATSLPQGWSVGLFATGRAAACPNGGGAHDVVAGPVAGAGACDCACTPSASCTDGTITTKLSDDASCSMQGVSFVASGATCTSLGGGGNLRNHFSAHAPPANATCTTLAVADVSKVASTPERLCEVPAACTEDVCGGIAPTGFAACIYKAGDVACPGAPWTTRTLVGDDASLACAACSACTATATCTNASIHFFSDMGCTQSVATLAVNDTCVATGGGGYVAAFTYAATATNASCIATGPKTPTVGLTATRTICCH